MSRQVSASRRCSLTDVPPSGVVEDLTGLTWVADEPPEGGYGPEAAHV